MLVRADGARRAAEVRPDDRQTGSRRARTNTGRLHVDGNQLDAAGQVVTRPPACAGIQPVRRHAGRRLGARDQPQWRNVPTELGRGRARDLRGEHGPRPRQRRTRVRVAAGTATRTHRSSVRGKRQAGRGRKSNETGRVPARMQKTRRGPAKDLRVLEVEYVVFPRVRIVRRRHNSATCSRVPSRARPVPAAARARSVRPRVRRLGNHDGSRDHRGERATRARETGTRTGDNS